VLQVYDVSIDYINSDDFRISTLLFFRELVKKNTLDSIIQAQSLNSLNLKPKVKSFYELILKDINKTKADEVLNKAVTKLLQDTYYDQQLLDQFVASSKEEYFTLKDLSYYTDNIKIDTFLYNTKFKVDTAIASFVKRLNDGTLALIDINRPKSPIPSTGTNQTNNSSSTTSQTNTNSTTSTNTSQPTGGVNNTTSNTDASGNIITTSNTNTTNASNATNAVNQSSTNTSTGNSTQNTNSYIPIIDPNASLREIISESDYINANKSVFMNHASSDIFNTKVIKNILSIVSDKIYRDYLLLTLFENIDIDTYTRIFEDVIRERIRVEKFLGDSLLDTYLKMLNNPTYEAAVAKSKSENKPMAFIISLEIMNEELPVQIAKQELSTALSLVTTRIKDELNKQFPADFFPKFPGIDVYLNDLSLALNHDSTDAWSTNWKDLKNSMRSNHDSDKRFANFLTYDAVKFDALSTSNVNTAGTGEAAPDGTGVLDYYTPAIIASNYGNNSTVLMTARAIKDYLRRIYPFFKTTTPYPYLASPFGE
jgi:hypothetical protein